MPRGCRVFLVRQDFESHLLFCLVERVGRLAERRLHFSSLRKTDLNRTSFSFLLPFTKHEAKLRLKTYVTCFSFTWSSIRLKPVFPSKKSSYLSDLLLKLHFVINLIIIIRHMLYQLWPQGAAKLLKQKKAKKKKKKKQEKWESPGRKWHMMIPGLHWNSMVLKTPTPLNESFGTRTSLGMKWGMRSTKRGFNG